MTDESGRRAATLVACLALFTDMLVYGIAIPVLPLLPATVAAGPAATGLLFAAYAVAMIIATPVAGRLVDRAGPRRPLLYALLGLAAATLLFAVGGPFVLLLLARFAQGVAAGMSWVAGLSLIAANTPVETRGRSLGLAMSMVSVGILVGPPLAGLLVDAFGTTAPFLVAAGIALADGVVRVLLVRHDPPATDTDAGPRAVLRVPGSGSVLLAVVIGAGTIAAIEPILPVHLSTTQHLTPLAVGALFAVAVLAGAALNPVVGGRVSIVDARWLVVTGGVLAAVAFAVLAVADAPWQSAVALAVLGASNAFVLAPASALIGFQGIRADPPTLGGSYAAFNLAYATGLFFGPLLGGALTGVGGFGVATGTLAGLTALATAVSVRRLPTGRQPATVD